MSTKMTLFSHPNEEALKPHTHALKYTPSCMHVKQNAFNHTAVKIHDHSDGPAKHFHTSSKPLTYQISAINAGNDCLGFELVGIYTQSINKREM